jgi:hypothetical protein
VYALSGTPTPGSAKREVKKVVFWEGVASDTIYHWFRMDLMHTSGNISKVRGMKWSIQIP